MKYNEKNFFVSDIPPEELKKLEVQWQEIERQSAIVLKKRLDAAANLKAAFEKDLLTFAIEHKTGRVYSVQYDDEHRSDNSIRLDHYWRHFDFEHRAEAFSCLRSMTYCGFNAKVVIYRLNKAVEKIKEEAEGRPLYEFLFRPHSVNFELYMKYIEVMEEA